MTRKQNDTKEQKQIKKAVNAVDAQHSTAQAMFLLLCEAHSENAMYNAHCEAIAEDFERKLACFTNKEKNAHKRATNTLKSLSTFCKSAKVNCQAYRIDEALREFHTMKELLALDELSDCREARIKSHISFLIHEFAHACTYECKTVDRKTYFRFVLKQK